MMRESSLDNLAKLQKSLGVLGKRHDEWLKERDDQLRRGLNDMNVFTTLLDAGDEVRLHSRFIAFLLDPDGDHGQRDLFLKLFMDECGHPDFQINTELAQVRCEYKDIDIYITDGRKHVIIENKIWAQDQNKQIQRYVETINEMGSDIIGEKEYSDKNDDSSQSENEKNDNDGGQENNIFVIYLSLGREKPSEKSLGDWEVEGNKLVPKDEKDSAQHYYRDLHYRPFKDGEHGKGIWSWLSRSHKQIRNITNLSVAITQYRDVIDKLYGRYEGDTMNFADYLRNNPKDFENLAESERLLREIDIWKIRRELADSFWKQVFQRLSGALDSYDGWKVHEAKTKRGRPNGLNCLITGTPYELPLQVRFGDQKKSQAFFAFEYLGNNHHSILIGLCFHYIGNVGTESKWGELIRKTPPDEISKQLQCKNRYDGGWAWPWYIGKYLDVSLAEIVYREGQPDNYIDKAAETLVADFMKFFEVFEGLMRKCNSA